MCLVCICGEMPPPPYIDNSRKAGVLRDVGREKPRESKARSHKFTHHSFSSCAHSRRRRPLTETMKHSIHKPLSFPGCPCQTSPVPLQKVHPIHHEWHCRYLVPRKAQTPIVFKFRGLRIHYKNTRSLSVAAVVCGVIGTYKTRVVCPSDLGLSGSAWTRLLQAHDSNLSCNHRSKLQTKR